MQSQTILNYYTENSFHKVITNMAYIIYNRQPLSPYKFLFCC